MFEHGSKLDLPVWVLVRVSIFVSSGHNAFTTFYTQISSDSDSFIEFYLTRISYVYFNLINTDISFSFV